MSFSCSHTPWSPIYTKEVFLVESCHRSCVVNWCDVEEVPPLKVSYLSTSLSFLRRGVLILKFLCSGYLGHKKFESFTYDLSSLQDTHFQGFNSTPINYYILKIDTSKFDGNYLLTWIFQMEQFFETMMKQLRNQAIMEYLIKWKNLPIEDSTSKDSFIHKRQKLIKHWGQCLSKEEGCVKP